MCRARYLKKGLLKLANKWVLVCFDDTLHPSLCLFCLGAAGIQVSSPSHWAARDHIRVGAQAGTGWCPASSCELEKVMRAGNSGTSGELRPLVGICARELMDLPSRQDRIGRHWSSCITVTCWIEFWLGARLS